MNAYSIARARMHDPVEYRRYADVVPKILADFGGRILVRGGRHKILEGPHDFDCFVVEFPSMEAATACDASAAYQDTAKFRGGLVGQVEIAIVENVDPGA